MDKILSLLENGMNILKVILILGIILVCFIIICILLVLIIKIILDSQKYFLIKKGKMSLNTFNKINIKDFTIWCNNFIESNNFSSTSILEKSNNYSIIKCKKNDKEYIILCIKHFYSFRNKYIDDHYLNFLLGILEEYKIQNAFLITNGIFEGDVISLKENCSENYNISIIDGNKLCSKYNFNELGYSYFGM